MSREIHQSPLSSVEEMLYAAMGVPTESEEALKEGIVEEFNDEFLSQDASVTGEVIRKKITAQIFPDGQTQTFTPGAEEWRQGLVDFAVRTTGYLEPSLNGKTDEAAGTLGQIIVVLLGMAKPETQVGVTINGGITSEGQILGHVAERTRLLLNYSEKLEQNVFGHTKP